MSLPVASSLPMVFVHGWGQSRSAWYQQYDVFAGAQYLNLPGHGGAADADDWLAAVLAGLPDEPCILVGWSLGGMLAMQLAAAYPARIAGLALVGSTPKFVSGEGWPHAVGRQVLDGFRQALDVQSDKLMGRFFAMMFSGDIVSRETYRDIARQAVNKQQPTSHVALLKGLQLLGSLDLRPLLEKLSMPVWLAHGRNDAIVPPEAMAYLAAALPHAAATWFDDCGHAPMLTQSTQFNEQLEAWCRTISTRQK